MEALLEQDVESATEPTQFEKCVGSSEEAFKAEAELKTFADTINRNHELAVEHERAATTKYKAMLEARWTIGRTLKRVKKLLESPEVKAYLEERGEPTTLAAWRQKYCAKLTERTAERYMVLAKKPLGEIKKYRSMRQAALATGEMREADLDPKKKRASKPEGEKVEDDEERKANNLVSKYIMLRSRIDDDRLFTLFKPIYVMCAEYLERKKQRESDDKAFGDVDTSLQAVVNEHDEEAED